MMPCQLPNTLCQLPKYDAMPPALYDAMSPAKYDAIPPAKYAMLAATYDAVPMGVISKPTKCFVHWRAW